MNSITKLFLAGLTIWLSFVLIKFGSLVLPALEIYLRFAGVDQPDSVALAVTIGYPLTVVGLGFVVWLGFIVGGRYRVTVS